MVISNYRCYIFLTGDLEFLFNYNNSIFSTFELWLYYIWTSSDVDAVNIYFLFWSVKFTIWSSQFQSTDRLKGWN